MHSAFLSLSLLLTSPNSSAPLARTWSDPASSVIPAEREVEFAGFEELQLVGTLTVPTLEAGARAPGVLLLPGSGPTDRNGNQPPALVTDLLKQIATRLGAEGFCVLRFDKRAAHTYKDVWPAGDELMNDFFRFEAFVGDAERALEFLRAQPEVDAKHVAILGHSEGGLIALQIGHDLAGTPEVPAALVLAGTAGTTFEPLIRYQVTTALAQQVLPDELKHLLIDQLEFAMKQVLEQGTVPPDLHPGLRALFPANATKLLRAYYLTDPLALAKSYPGPVLVLHGEKDAQVPAPEHPDLMTAALRSRGKGSVETLVIDDASHNLKRVTGPQDGGFTGPVVPAALDGIAAFLKKALAD